jgi:N-acetyltransferase 10
MLDYHVVMDLLPTIARQYFSGKFKGSQLSAEPTKEENPLTADPNAGSSVVLSAVQKAVLLGMGLQHKSVDTLSAELGIPVSQLLALFIRAIRKISAYYKRVSTEAVEKTIEPAIVPSKSSEPSTAGTKRALEDEEAWDPTEQTLADDLDEGESEMRQALRERQRELISSLDLKQYAIAGDDDAWQSALTDKQRKKASGVVSIANPASSKLEQRKRYGTTVDAVAAEGRKLAEKALAGKKKSNKKIKSKK